MGIFKTLFEIFVPPTDVRRENENKLLSDEFSVIFIAIRESRTLSELVSSRALVTDYKTAVTDLGSPVWAINKLKILQGQWNRQYRLWKARG